MLDRARELLAAGRAAAAEPLLRAAAQRPALHAEAQYLLAVAALMGSRPAEALAAARASVAARPQDARFEFMLGRACKAGGDLEGAEAAYRRALALQPRFADAMVSLGIVLKLRGDVDAAVALQEKAIELEPRNAAAHANLANALALRAEMRTRAGAEAEVDPERLDAQGRAVALDPKNAQLHRNYGVLLLGARRHREAAAAFNEALTLDPADVEACLRLGACLVSLGDSRLAIRAYETWLQRNPPRAAVMRALAAVLTRGGEIDAALPWAQRALALEADAQALLNLGSTLMQSRRLDDSLARCREGVEAGGRRAELYPALLLGMNYLHESPVPLFAAHAEFAAALPAAPARPRWRTRPERLRIGYVSGDFVRHSVSYFFAALLEERNRERFEVVCYHNSAQADAVTARFMGQADRWREVDALSDEALRAMVVGDGIDVLVDLSGHTAGSRVFVFAAGAAPLQVGYLGYPTVSGVPAMDFRITDTTIDPGDQPVLPHDRPLALPRSMFCYRPDDAPPLAPPPALRNGCVTFGSFNNIAKVTDHTLELWAAAMNAVPDSRLLLKATAMAQPSNRRNIEAFMGQRGIAAERLQLVAWRPDKEGHLQLYNDVDIALDTFPYNGATTSCEALWMGLPVLTRRGATHVSRMGASLLAAIGRGDWVAMDDDGFVALATQVASDLDALRRWRAGAREALLASELFDRLDFARAFEKAIDDAWTLRGASS